MNNIMLRHLEKRDIAQCADMISENYCPEFGRKAECELFEMFGTAHVRPTYIVSECAGTIVGFGGFMLSWMDWSFYTIFWVNVRKDCQHRGIGTLIVQDILNRIRRQPSATYVILTTTLPTFYEKNFGFKTLDRFGSKVDDEVFMGLKL